MRIQKGHGRCFGARGRWMWPVFGVFASLGAGCGETSAEADAAAGAPDDRATLPAIAVDFGCDVPADHWEGLCDWVAGADAIVYGTIEEMTLFEPWEDEPEEALGECTEDTQAGNLRITVDVTAAPFGEVGERVEVFVVRPATAFWAPRPFCTEDEPSTPSWRGGEDFGGESGEGPLEIGQKIGMRVVEQGDMLFFKGVVDPLFTERGGSTFFQPGAAFACHDLRAEISAFEKLTIGEFSDEIAACENELPEGACELQAAAPCFEGACCPEGCEKLEGKVYDMDAECEVGVGVYGCAEPSYEADDAPGYYCSPDGDRVIRADEQPAGATEPEELVFCTDLDDYDDNPTEVADFPECA